MVRSYSVLFVVFVVGAALLCGCTTEAAREPECEVCIKMVDRIIKQNEETPAKTEEDVENLIRKVCKDIHKDVNKNDVAKNEKFCYYIGGSATSATGIMKKVSPFVMAGLPSDRICKKKLHPADSQICELKYEKPLDLDTVDLTKLRVKQLKKILTDFGESCKGCTEKQEFINKINKIKQATAKDEL